MNLNILIKLNIFIIIYKLLLTFSNYDKID